MSTATREQPPSLTRREREILALLASRLSDREIAEKLTMALSSVKWYTRQIYNKLGAGNRREAVSRAAELGLLEASGAGGFSAPGYLAPPAARPNHNLPRQLTRLVGREQEIEQVLDLLGQSPLVTLTGTGGVGKTRLALAAAEKVTSSDSDDLPAVPGRGAARARQAQPLDDPTGMLFPGGVWFVELGSLSDPQAVARAVAGAAGLREDSQRPTLETLLSYFHDCQALLVLDTCEHLIEACAELAGALLSGLPRLKILATSREPLGLPGEVTYRVPSLAFPQAHPPVSGEEYPSPAEPGALESYPSIRLFLDRVQAALPGFRLTPRNTAHVAAICRRLDGIPLAIELAAPQVASLGVDQVASHLDQAFRLLAGARRVGSERQRTLRATIDWSYQLLSSPEKLLFRRLSVFQGGFSLEAAEEICADLENAPENITHAEVPGLLAQLVSKSIIVAEVQEQAGLAARYYLLDTLRQYARELLSNQKLAQERLAEIGEEQILRDRHLAYFVRLGRQIYLELRTDRRLEGLVQYSEEQANFHEALNGSLNGPWSARAETGLRLANDLLFYWVESGFIAEGRAWLEKGLALYPTDAAASAEPLSSALPARTLRNLGELLFHTHSPETREVMERSIALLRACGDRANLAVATIILGMNLKQDDPGRCQALFAEALEIVRSINVPENPRGFEDKWDLAMILYKSAELAGEQGKYDLALRYAQESVAVFHEIGDRWTASKPQYILALLCARQGDRSKLRVYFRELEALSRETQDIPYCTQSRYYPGVVAYFLDDFTRMEAHILEARAIYQRYSSKWSLSWALRMLAVAAKRQNRIRQAADLYLEDLTLSKAIGEDCGLYACLLGIAGTAAQAQPAHAASAGSSGRSAPEGTASTQGRRIVEQSAAVPAARLLAAGASFVERENASLELIEEFELERDRNLLRTALGESAFQSAWAEGREMTCEQAVQEAHRLGEELGYHQ